MANLRAFILRLLSITFRSLPILAPAAAMLTATPNAAVAQWHILDVFPATVRAIHFLDLPGPPRIGFAGLANGEVWRTSDGGATWAKTSAPGCTGYITAFTFKDSLVGWFSAHARANADPGVCYRTTDGGLTWKELAQDGTRSAIYYHRPTRTLYVSAWEDDDYGRYSTDDGNTWKDMPNRWMNGYAFLSANDGIITNTGLTSPKACLVTHDGGRSWQPAPMSLESYQPVAVPALGEYFAAAEEAQQVLRSTDRGHTWNAVYTYTGHLTGWITAIDTVLVIQTYEGGFLASKDRGATWFPICGPSGDIDTRFWNRGDTIFAGDGDTGLWATYSALASTDRSKMSAVVSDTVFAGSGCAPVRRTITITNNDCIPMLLDSVSAWNEIAGSRQFTVLRDPTTPLEIPPGGSRAVEIEFNPAVRGSGRARLRLLSRRMGLDSSIMLRGTSDVDVSIGASITDAAGRPGQIVSTTLGLTFGSGAADLPYSFALRFNRTVLAPRAATPHYTEGRDYIAQFSGTVPTGGRIDIPLEFLVMLGDTDRTPLAIESATIDADCFGAATVRDGLVTVEGICREGSTRLIDAGFAHLLRLKPNPASDELLAVMEPAEAGWARLVLRDASGREAAVLFDAYAPRGTHEVHAALGGLPSGLYFATLSAGTQTATVPLAIIR